MTDREQIIALRNEADKFATEKLLCEGEYHPDFHTVSDERFYAIAFEAGSQSVDTPVALAEAYRCGEEAGRQAEREECLNICINHASDYAVFNCEPYESMEQGALSCALTIRARSTK